MSVLNPFEFPNYLEDTIIEILEEYGFSLKTIKPHIEKLRHALKIFSKYGTGKETLYNTKEKCLAYFVNYFPIFYSNLIFILYSLLLKYKYFDLLDNEMSILEIGTGPGSIPIGLIDFLKKYRNNDFELKFQIFERNGIFCEIYNKLKEKIEMNQNKTKKYPTIIQKEFNFGNIDSELELINNQFNFIILANVIEENSSNKSQIREYLEKISLKLKDNGLIIILIIPSDKFSSWYEDLYKSELIKPIAPFCDNGKFICDDICRITQIVKFDKLKKTVQRPKKESSFSFLVLSKISLDLKKYFSIPSDYTPLNTDFKEGTKHNIIGLINQIQEKNIVPRNLPEYKNENGKQAIYICDGWYRAKILNDTDEKIIDDPENSGELMLFKNVEYIRHYPKGRGKKYNERVFKFISQSSCELLS